MKTLTGMKLEDTIEGMKSADYKERFVAEYQQLKIRHDKLERFIRKTEVYEEMYEKACQEAAGYGAKRAIKPSYDDIPKHDCPLCLLHDQESVMRSYLEILEQRAIWEGIDLVEA